MFICSDMTLAMDVALGEEEGRVKGVEMWGAVKPLRGWEKKEAEERVEGRRAGEERGELCSGADTTLLPSADISC